jgi:hypothetical protein
MRFRYPLARQAVCSQSREETKLFQPDGDTPSVMPRGLPGDLREYDKRVAKHVSDVMRNKV